MKVILHTADKQEYAVQVDSTNEIKLKDVKLAVHAQLGIPPVYQEFKGLHQTYKDENEKVAKEDYDTLQLMLNLQGGDPGDAACVGLCWRIEGGGCGCCPVHSCEFCFCNPSKCGPTEKPDDNAKMCMCSIL